MKRKKFSAIAEALDYIRALKKKKITGYLNSHVLKTHETKPWKVEWSVRYSRKKKK